MNKVHFGGIPTDGDVRILSERFGVPKPGDEIKHEDVESALRLQRNSNRYRAVTLAWRKRMLRDHNVDISAIPGTGFRCLTDSERVAAGVSGIQSGLRKQLHSVVRADRVQTDDESLRAKQDVLRRYGVALRAEATKAMRAMEPPKPVEQSPRRVLPFAEKQKAQA